MFFDRLSSSNTFSPLAAGRLLALAVRCVPRYEARQYSSVCDDGALRCAPRSGVVQAERDGCRLLRVVSCKDLRQRRMQLARVGPQHYLFDCCDLPRVH